VSGPVVIAGGGTGGHVFVADAVASALLDKGLHRGDLRFLGSRRGQERDLLGSTGIELVLLPGRGIKRSFALRAIFDNAGALAGVAWALVRSLALLVRWWPRAVVSVGGYAAGPAGLAAVILRRPLILVNIDAVPGVTHRILGRFARASCVSFASTPLPNSVVTGAPVRPAFAGLDRSTTGMSSARSELGCDPDRPLVAVTTGSLGARSVNRAVLGLATMWAERSVTIYHVTGRRDFDEIAAAKPDLTLGGLDYRIVAFEDQVPLLYQAATVAITRAGALTVAELSLAGLPAVLVPLPGAPGDHQTLNANALGDVGAAVMVADRDVTTERLATEVEAILLNDSKRQAMQEAAMAVGHRDAAVAVATVVLEHA